MRVTINGIEYESVDAQIVDGMDVSCRECDIFKAKIPKSVIEYPLCCEPGSGGVVKQGRVATPRHHGELNESSK